MRQWPRRDQQYLGLASFLGTEFSAISQARTDESDLKCPGLLNISKSFVSDQMRGVWT